jgi:hypothetical protein
MTAQSRIEEEEPSKLGRKKKEKKEKKTKPNHLCWRVRRTVDDLIPQFLRVTNHATYQPVFI